MTFDSSFFFPIIMKKIIVLLLYAVLFIACSVEERFVPFFNLSDDTLEYDWGGGIQGISIETNDTWHISSSIPSWLVVDSKSETNLTFTIDSNNTKEPRFCDVIFSTTWQTDTLHIVQTAKERLAFVGEKYLFMNAEENYFSVELDKNINFETIYLNNVETWLAQIQKFQVNDKIPIGSIKDFITNNKLYFKIKENLTSNQRLGKIVIRNDNYGLADTLSICQAASTEKYYKDGEVVLMQRAIRGNVNLVIMCDGFVSKDLNYDGKYCQAVCAAVDNFFSIEPYTTYRDYFNVYMVAAESEEAGVGEKGGVKSVRNKFGTAFGSGTEIVCNSDLILEYARKVEELPSDRPLSVIVVLNSTKYAGTTYMYSNGNSIALCPMSAKDSPNDFEGLVHHEAGGHGFGFLCDEYIYYDRNIPEDEKRNIKEWQKLGFQMNLDFTDNLSAILWKDFIGQPGYEPVGAFEGGSQYQYGVWRPEKNSCMNNNIPYFNVQSRWNIVRRIMKLSGMDISVREFMEKDKPVYPSEAVITRAASDFIPLGNPVWIK